MKTARILCVFLTLVTAALSQPASDETEYFAVYLQGKKIGYAIHTMTAADSKVTTTEKVNITISRMNIPITIQTSEASVETKDGEPISFEANQNMSMMQMKISGKIDANGLVSAVTSAMGNEQKRTFAWPSGALMSEGLRLLQAKYGLKQGTKYTVKVFVPSMMQAFDTEVLIGPRQKVDLLGRIVTLTEVTTKTNIPLAGEIVSTTYVDNDFRVQKSITPVMDMQIELLASPKEFALSKNDELELFEKMFLESPEPIMNVNSVESIRYYLSQGPDANNLEIPSTDSQQVEKDKNGKIIVTVKPATAPSGIRFPYKGKDRAILEAIEPTRFLQSDHKEIIALAKRAVGNTRDAGEAVKRIESFVAEYIENKSLSVGYASAAEVAASRQGDCSEFAVLTAAMCRAVGIPAKVVVGIAYVDDFFGLAGFGGHAWAEVYIGGKWVGLDASFKASGRGGYDAGHIALASGNGNPEDFFKIAFSLGRFSIDRVVTSKD